MFQKECLYFDKDNLMHSKWNPTLRSYEQSVVTDDYRKFLNDSCELSTNVTLKDIFLFLKKDLIFWESIYPDLKEFIIDLENPASKSISDEEVDEEPLDYLELYYMVTQSHKTRLSKEISFYGLRYPDFHAKSKASDTNYSISFLKLSDIAHLPVVLCKKNQLVFSGKRQPLPLGEVSFTLYAIIAGIMEEIQWHGPPAVRNASGTQLIKRLNEAIEEVDKAQDQETKSKTSLSD